MGINNKQRRASKRRKQRDGRGPSPRATPRVLTAHDVRHLLNDVVAEIWEDSTAAERSARLLLEPFGPLTPGVAQQAVRSLLDGLVATAVTSGWSPGDLAQITVRSATEQHVPLVVGLLHDLRRHQRAVPDAWSADLAECGAAAPLDLATVDGMRRGLEVAAVLGRLPAIAPVVPAPGSAAPAAPSAPRDAKLLARVQALLAKAEATEYAEEAEALSAKAQELVSRHALEQLLAEADGGTTDDEPVVRRLWLDAPYVFPKAMLVHVVAEANRCRSVVSEALGFCTLVGRAGDLAAVELLVPSLLVQAHTAMRRYGSTTDGRGTSRTRSFRQSFLLAYAGRIGERLRTAADDVMSASGRSGALVPVLREHRERLDATCDELFPELTAKSGTVGNAQGWAAGRAAADEALLGAEQQVTAAAS